MQNLQASQETQLPVSLATLQGYPLATSNYHMQLEPIFEGERIPEIIRDCFIGLYMPTREVWLREPLVKFGPHEIPAAILIAEQKKKVGENTIENINQSTYVIAGLLGGALKPPFAVNLFGHVGAKVVIDSIAVDGSKAYEAIVANPNHFPYQWIMPCTIGMMLDWADQRR